MASVTISEAAIHDFLAEIQDTPPETTHLPTKLPLSFPTPLHRHNTICAVHFISTLLSQPKHVAYFAATVTSSTDTAVRGVLGLYLSSSEVWNKDNYLSAESWRAGAITEGLIGSYFGIEIMREETHETLPGIKVGTRWKEGASLVEDMIDLLRGVGERIEGQCLGEVVQRTLEESQTEAGSQESFARLFCDRVSSGPDSGNCRALRNAIADESSGRGVLADTCRPISSPKCCKRVASKSMHHRLTDGVLLQICYLPRR